MSRYVAAPFPHRYVPDVQLLQRSPIDGLQRLLAVTTEQGMTYLWPDLENPLWMLLRYQALGIVLWMTGLAFRRRRNDAGQGAPGRPPWRRAERRTHVLNLSLIGPAGADAVARGVVDGLSYRCPAPVAVAAAVGRMRPGAGGRGGGFGRVPGHPSFFAAYKQLASRQFTDERARIDAFAAQTGGTLVYQAQDDPWCNTILLPFQTAFLPESLAIPAGIGISFDFDIASRTELKSRYVMVDDESRDSLTEAFDLQFASATAIGDLYRNGGISCSD